MGEFDHSEWQAGEGYKQRVAEEKRALNKRISRLEAVLEAARPFADCRRKSVPLRYTDCLDFAAKNPDHAPPPCERCVLRAAIAKA